MRGALPIAAAVIVTSLGACGVDVLGDPHPYDQLDYPVGVTADPSGETVWVTSGNFDLAFGGGAVLGIDVQTHRFIKGAAAEVGSFPGRFHILAGEDGQADGYVLSRETDAMYHVVMSRDSATGDPQLTCKGGRLVKDSAGEVVSVRCFDARTTTRDVVNPVNPTQETTLRVGGDPYGAVVRPARLPGEPDLVVSGAMVDGTAATFEIVDESEATETETRGTPRLVGNLDLDDGLFAFAYNPVTGHIYAGSKLTGSISVLEARFPKGDELPASYANPYLNLVRRITIPQSLVADHARGLAVTGDGTLLLATYRAPDSLVIVDIAPTDTGGASGRVIDKVPLCRRPGDVVVVPGTADMPELAYVSCFSADKIAVVDPRRGEVVDEIYAGRGPFGAAFVDNPELGIRRLYVANFYGQSVGVFELDPASPYFHTQIAEVR